MGEARRTRSVGSKLTEEEYAKFEALAAQRGVTPGECVRDLVLSAFEESRSEATPTEQALLSEVLALRTIQMAPGNASSDVMTGHELEHANDGITQGQNSFQQGAAAMVNGDAPSKPGENNTVGGTAQARAEETMGEKTDMSGGDAGAAFQDILKPGRQQWQDSQNKANICSQNQRACH